MIDCFCFANCGKLATVTCSKEWKVLRLKSDGSPVIERQTEFSAPSGEMLGCLHLY
jgi:hypothetical protein